MNYTGNEDFQLYFGRVRPVYHQLFNMAHAITGNAAQAEYCLQYALLDCWKGGESSHRGLRDALKRSVVRAAVKNTAMDAADWDALQAPPDDPDALRRMIAQENIETRRILALKYGCGLPLGRIARLMDTDAGCVKQLIERFEARTRRRLEASDRRKYDILLHQSMRSFFAAPSPLAPEMGSVFRSFQADAAGIAKPSRLPMRIAQWVFTALLAIACVVAFWFAAVLIQPPVLEEAPQIAVEESMN